MYNLSRQGSDAGFLFVPPAILSKRPSSVGSFPGATLAGTQAEFTVEDFCFMATGRPPTHLLPVPGEPFGKWIVISVTDRDHVNCQCECGNTATVSTGDLRNEKTTQCRPCVIVHGAARDHNRTVEYNTWLSIKNRCSGANPQSEHYRLYYLAGVRVAEEWIGAGGFERFLTHVGLRPSDNHSIDRFPNPEGNYEPGNVRWATPKEQARNKRNNHLAAYDGRTQCVSAWAEEWGISWPSAKRRLRKS